MDHEQGGRSRIFQTTHYSFAYSKPYPPDTRLNSDFHSDHSRFRILGSFAKHLLLRPQPPIFVLH